MSRIVISERVQLRRLATLTKDERFEGRKGAIALARRLNSRMRPIDDFSSEQTLYDTYHSAADSRRKKARKAKGFSRFLWLLVAYYDMRATKYKRQIPSWNEPRNA